MEKGRESGTSSAAYPTSDICSGKWPVLPNGESMPATAVLTRRNIGWPKGQIPLPDSPFPVARDSMERPRGPVPLARSEKKSRSCKNNGAFWQQRLSEARWMQGQRSCFKGRLTIDDDLLAPLDSFRHGRRRGLLVRPSFGSHGAARPRSETQPLCFLWASCHAMIRRSRGSAAQSLDAVVLG
jgi:hypothetical protein